MAALRSLKIKTSSCKRIVKELHSYEKEVQREAAKTADMKDKGADPYDLKQQVPIPHVFVSLSLINLNPPNFPFLGFEFRFQFKSKNWIFLVFWSVCLPGKCVGGIEDDDSWLPAAIGDLLSWPQSYFGTSLMATELHMALPIYSEYALILILFILFPGGVGRIESKWRPGNWRSSNHYNRNWEPVS